MSHDPNRYSYVLYLTGATMDPWGVACVLASKSHVLLLCDGDL